jgi:hypothetical protein
MPGQPVGGQPGYGQQPPPGYGAQPGYGMPPGGFGQPGYGGGFPPPGPPRPKTNVGLIIAIVVGAIVVLGGGIVGIALAAGSGASVNAGPAGSTVTSTPDSGSGGASDSTTDTGGASGGSGSGAGGGSGSFTSPDALANAYVDALNNKNGSEFASAMCSNMMGGSGSIPTGIPAPDQNSSVSASSAGSVTINGNTATAPVNESIQSAGHQLSITIDLQMSNSGGSWCVSGFAPIQGSGG